LPASFSLASVSPAAVCTEIFVKQPGPAILNGLSLSIEASIYPPGSLTEVAEPTGRGPGGAEAEYNEGAPARPA
jgi:hypothetical protein